MNNDSCRLIAVNLFGSVRNPFTQAAYFDYKHFYEVIYEAQRLMDDVVALEIEHIQRILAKIERDEEPEHIKSVERRTWQNLLKTGLLGRRTGLGLTGLGDTLAALGLKYDSPESLLEVDSIMRMKLTAEWDSSIDMSVERGSFGVFDAKLEKNYAKKHKDSFFAMLEKEFPELWERNLKYGRRNISISTVAPTGSLSILAQVTSGIEPLFTPYYTRRKKINPSDGESRVDFVDQNGDKWQEFAVLHPKFKDWINRGSMFGDMIEENWTEDMLKEAFEQSPWYGSTANDIDWIERVKIQSVIQKYTTHSISSTINLPNDVTVDKVKEIYLESWKMGLKGITVYRDGSRTGVLVTNTEDDFTQHDAPKRPKELPAECHTVTVKGEKFKVIIGLLKNKPYEVFAYPTKERLSTEGVIYKRGRGEYIFQYGDDETKVLTDKMSDEQAALTRMISTALRHGASIQFVVEQLYKNDGEIVSFSKSIARVLKKYVSEEELLQRATCQDCGSENLKFEEGCMTCLDCGSSKCG